MKLLHVSDWHLGRAALGQPRDADFDAVLTEVVGIARDTRPDAIVHTGDLFDVVRPAVTDMSRGIRALQALARVAPVVVLAGNHDSPALLRLFGAIANGFSAGEDPGAAGRITFSDRARPPSAGGIVDLAAAGGAQRLRLAPLPFVHANRFLDGFRGPQTATRDYADHLRAVAELHRGLLEGYRPDADVLVFAAHLYVEGALLSHSERPLEVTATYASAAASLPPVAYAALGHIHRPQAVVRTGLPTRYAGSPLQLDFGETGEDKSVVLVAAEPSRPAHAEVIPLTAGRRLVEVTGTLDTLAAQADAVGDAIVKVLVDTETPTVGLAELVADRLPKATLALVEERCAATRVHVLDRSTSEHETEPDITELFRDYLSEVGTKRASVDHTLLAFRDLLAEAAHVDPADGCTHDHGRLPEEELLTAALAGAPVPPGVTERLITTGRPVEGDPPPAPTRRRRQGAAAADPAGDAPEGASAGPANTDPTEENR
jgi:exonuclease SbcD